MKLWQSTVDGESSHLAVEGACGGTTLGLQLARQTIEDGGRVLWAAPELPDGVRCYDFPLGDGSYWYQRYSIHSHYPLSSGEHTIPDYQVNNQKITNFYNYPNPIKDRETTFRFMVHQQINIDIIKMR